MLRFCLFALLAVLVPGLALGQDCARDAVCVEVAQEGADYAFYVVNPRPHDVTVRFEVELLNMSADAAFPSVSAFPARARTKAFTLRQGDGRGSWRYHYRYAWQIGRVGARHDDRYVYALPYAPGEQFVVGQGYGGSFSHQGRNAIDWVMPEGTPVYAARDGVVVAVCDSNRVGGLDEALRDHANFILVGHDDGTVGSYVHLMPGGALVRPGDVVARGQHVGYSGHTGYSSGPHLHFEVFTVDSNLQRRTLPVRFDLGARTAVLEAGRAYGAPGGRAILDFRFWILD